MAAWGRLSSCYAMALSGGLAKAGGTRQSLEVQADGFLTAAEEAKAGCPVSKALAAVDITLDAALES